MLKAIEDEFKSIKNPQLRYHYRHKEELKEKRKQRIKNNPEKYKEQYTKQNRKRKESKRWYRLKKIYGISKEDFYKLFEEQNKVCAICKQPDPVDKEWHLDHDHRTEKIRGILCAHCNWLLGNAKDSVEILNSAIKYLKKHDCPSLY